MSNGFFFPCSFFPSLFFFFCFSFLSLPHCDLEACSCPVLVAVIHLFVKAAFSPVCIPEGSSLGPSSGTWQAGWQEPNKLEGAGHRDG